MGQLVNEYEKSKGHEMIEENGEKLEEKRRILLRKNSKGFYIRHISSTRGSFRLWTITYYKLRSQ